MFVFVLRHVFTFCEGALLSDEEFIIILISILTRTIRHSSRRKLLQVLHAVKLATAHGNVCLTLRIC